MMNTNTAYEILRTRRSIRSYQSSPAISDEEVRALLVAGMNAPTARNRQPWRFVVIDDRAQLDAFADFHPYAKMVHQAPLGIVVCIDTQKELAPGYGVADCSNASTNILNAAHALGLGSLWIGIYPREERMKWLSEQLGLPAHIVPLSFLAIGHTDVVAPEPRPYAEEKVHRNRW
ncbi:MAG: nitroreductase family protein [Candidatus Sumerlaeales bacterium]|nr:nitroreductase family protein [Candidatus Sumerlaeales bacterium]